MIDPKGDATSLVRLLQSRGRRARVLSLESAAPGLLDPFSFGDDLATKRTMATETLRLLLPRMSEERESAMIQAVGAVAAGPRPSLGKVVRHLEQADDPASKNLGAVMRSISEMRLARLCFAPSGGQQVDAEGWTTVFTLGGLTLPDTAIGRDDYSYEQRLSVALLYLVSQFARRLLNGMDRRMPKAIFLDEAWAITATPEGAKLVPEVSRMGRSRNTALILVSQNAGDLLNEQVTNCISSVFAFRSSERTEVQSVMSLLGVEASDEHKAVLRGLGNGEAIFRDLDGRAGRIGIDLASDELQRWLDTNPTRSRPDEASHLRGAPPAAGTESMDGTDSAAMAESPDNGPWRIVRTARTAASRIRRARRPAAGTTASRLRARRRRRPPGPGDRRRGEQVTTRRSSPGAPQMARSPLRWGARLLIVIGAIVAVPVYAAAAYASSPSGTGAPAAPVSVSAADGCACGHHRRSAHPGPVPPPAGAAQDAKAVLTAAHAAATPGAPAGGVCSVPGIGDIGGLLGLCSAGSSGIIGALNNVCQPSIPQPEPANGGIDALIQPPAGVAAGNTLYDSYGVAGQFWAAHGLQCSDMTSLIGNNVAGMVFDAAKSIDRVTITVYQSAAGNGILNWLQSVVDRLISALGNAIYFPYLAPVIILGAIWLAWNGLVRKRATRAIEGTLWMVVACAAAIWLIGRPADFTGVGTTVSNGVTQVLNVAFAKLPNPGGSNCVPVQGGDPQAASGNFGFTSSNGVVDNNANELWSVLVCKPWLDGELGTTQYATSAKAPQTVVNTYGRQLLWSQAIAVNEQPTSNLIQAKQATYNGIATALQQNNPAIYPLFQGNQWTTRLEIGFAALFAALVAGLLMLLIALTLIILKLGFLLLLIAGPFFLIIGTHPGFGRIIAIRWFEMLVGVLMKQVAVALALSVLLYAYSLIMGTSDAVLPWALKILMIALVTVAVFIYRKPFQHLFSAVGYGVIGSQDRADVSLRQASTTFRRVTRDTATVAVPGVAAYRVGRWARRNPGEAAALAAGIVGAAGAASAGAAAGKMAAAQAAGGAPGVTDEAAAGVRPVADGQPGDAEQAAQGSPGGATARDGGACPALAGRRRGWPALRAAAAAASPDR